MDVITCTMQANMLNELTCTLNGINRDYPRHVGNMVMIDPDMEDRIDGILVTMEACHRKLEILSDEELAELVEDVPEYRRFLDNCKSAIINNRQEVQRARDFLARYYS